MLVEFFKLITNQNCPDYIRNLKILHEIISIEARYSRCRDAWQEHIKNTKQTCADFLKTLPHGSRVLIVGAGSLNDVDLDFLQASGHDVTLLDIYFLNHIKKRLNKASISWLEADITGFYEQAFYLYKDSATSSELSDLAKLSKPDVDPDDYDAVISLNLLSQLALCLDHFGLEETVQEQISIGIIQGHIDFVESFKRYLLITDTDKKVLDIQSRVLAYESTVFNSLRLNKKNLVSTWDWHLAPRGELECNFSLLLEIHAFQA